MKKLMMLLLAMMLCLPALAEPPAAPAALPVQLLAHEEAVVPLAQAMEAAKAAVDEVPAQALIRAELAELADGAKVWVVTIFDTYTFLDCWCVTLDASTGAVAALEAGYCGSFDQTMAKWVQEKGVYALWSLDDKQRYDTLYALEPMYGLPLESDMSAGNALTKALFVLGMESSEGYAVGYGYLMGGEGYNGVWEITLVKNSQVAYRVNLDAVTGDVYYMEPDEAGNG